MSLDEGGLVGLCVSIMRRAALLFNSGVIAALALFGAVEFSQLYRIAVTMPKILEEIYQLYPQAVDGLS